MWQLDFDSFGGPLHRVDWSTLVGTLFLVQPSFKLDLYATCCSKPITLMVQFVSSLCSSGIEQFPCYFIFVWRPSLVPSPLQSRSFLHGWRQLSASMGPSIKLSPANSCKSNYLFRINYCHMLSNVIGNKSNLPQWRTRVTRVNLTSWTSPQVDGKQHMATNI